ncbi:hypothetical protein BCR44DRAFT_1432242, partial [Catenaria anguillulae PL171]
MLWVKLLLLLLLLLLLKRDRRRWYAHRSRLLHEPLLKRGLLELLQLLSREATNCAGTAHQGRLLLLLMGKHCLLSCGGCDIARQWLLLVLLRLHAASEKRGLEVGRQVRAGYWVAGGGCGASGCGICGRARVGLLHGNRVDLGS